MRLHGSHSEWQQVAHQDEQPLLLFNRFSLDHSYVGRVGQNECPDDGGQIGARLDYSHGRAVRISGVEVVRTAVVDPEWAQHENIQILYEACQAEVKDLD